LCIICLPPISIMFSERRAQQDGLSSPIGAFPLGDLQFDEETR
jgi:hypothetical protein